MTPEQGAARLERFAQELPGAAERGLDEALKLARERAIWWSSGPFSTAALRRMYRPRGPYSAVDPHPPADAGRINLQQAAGLAAQWAIAPASQSLGRVSGSVYNTSPEAAFMGHWEGEEFVQEPRSRMAARPLPVRVLADMERGTAVVERLEAAIEGAMR